jgi:hypothetical protein
MEWTPVEIGIGSNVKKAFGGSVLLSARQDGQNTLNIAHEFVLTPDVPLHLPLVTKLAFGADECSLRIVDKDGRTCWRHDFDLWNLPGQGGRLTAVSEKDLFIGLVGRRSFGLLGLADNSVCRSVSSRGDGAIGKVYLGEKLTRGVPWDWTGFAGLDLLIMYDPDWSLLNRHQFDAIAQWVANGGKLLVVLGSRPLPAENVIARLLPFEIGQAKQTTIEQVTLQRWNLNLDQAETVTCWPLTPKSNARICHQESFSGGQCLFGTGYAGFGRVGVLAFDPSTFTDEQKAQAHPFWVNRIAAVLDVGQNPPTSAEAQPAVQMPAPGKFRSRSAMTGDLTHPDDSDGGIELTISGLEPGSYKMTSYHNNPFRRHANIDIYVDGERHSSDNVQSSAGEDQSAARALTEFTVQAANDVVIEFRPVSSQHNERAVLCGFRLVRLGLAEPSDTGPKAPEPVFGIDIGDAGQVVAEGCIGLGFAESERISAARFDQDHGLPSGITVSLKPTNSQDTLQFIAAPDRSGRRRFSRPEVSGFPMSRTIEFVEDAEDQPEDHERDRRYRISRAQAGSNAIMEEHLYSIEQMRPLSIWWVIGLLTTLAVLLGPVDYKLLKRLGRLPMTWLTCAFWIVLFTGGAYYGVQELRGGRMKLRAVAVFDAIPDAGCMWSTTYLGFYAPRSADYRLQGVQGRQWWSGMVPVEESIWLYRREAGTRNIYCAQHDGSNLPYSLPVNIWTVQCLLNESPGQDLPFTAQLEDDGDHVIVNINNVSDSNIVKGLVLLGQDRVLDIGPVPAHSEKQFRDQPSHRRTWTDRDFGRYGPALRCEQAYFAQGSLQRTEGIRAYLAHGAAVVSVQYDGAVAPITVEDPRCEYDQVQLARLVVFPGDSALSAPEDTSPAEEKGQ